MFNKKAFTLIELLVVVLIIAILAAIALPQYQFAVEKSRTAQAFINLKALSDAVDRFFLTYNKWPATFDELDITIGQNCTTSLCPGGGDFTYRFYMSTNGLILAYKNKTSYSGTDFTVGIVMQEQTYSTAQMHKGDIVCFTRSNERFDRICRALGGKTKHAGVTGFMTSSTPFYIIGQ